MATNKPTVKKPKSALEKKPVAAAKKPKAKNPAAKKITVKPPTKAKPMVKMVVDRITLPKGGKFFVNSAKRPANKKAVKKAK
ncbi:MAG: hypothetical protein J6Q22_10740 [Prevotella sp.]|nr:hypothetical protein [Prevotella sp.]